MPGHFKYGNARFHILTEFLCLRNCVDSVSMLKHNRETNIAPIKGATCMHPCKPVAGQQQGQNDWEVIHPDKHSTRKKEELHDLTSLSNSAMRTGAAGRATLTILHHANKHKRQRQKGTGRKKDIKPALWGPPWRRPTGLNSNKKGQRLNSSPLATSGVSGGGPEQTSHRQRQTERHTGTEKTV